MNIDEMREDLAERLPAEWQAWTSEVGVRFTTSLPNGTDMEVSQIHGGAWQIVVGWPSIGDYDGTSWVVDTWGEVLVEIAEMGASLR